MKDTIQDLADTLRKMVTKKLLADDKMKPNETIVIKAVIMGSNGKHRKGLSLYQELNTFSRGGNIFYDRELTTEETQMIQQISFADQWQKGVVSEILQDNNAPINGKVLPDLAVNHGYRRKRSRHNDYPALWPSEALGGINQCLKASQHPFRLLKAEERRVDSGVRANFYRFYRMIEKTPKEAPTGSAEEAAVAPLNGTVM